MIAGTAATAPFPWNEADEMLTLLIKRAAERAHWCPGTQEEKEFDSLAHAIEAYEVKRWPASPDVLDEIPPDRYQDMYCLLLAW